MRQKRNKFTRFFAGLCILLMFLSSCGEKGLQPADTDGSGGTGASVKHPTEGVALLLKKIADGETVFNARKIDLPLEKDEFLYDVVAEEDGYRIVVGYIDEENYPRPFCTNGPVYVSEYRYLDKEYREDASQREPSLKGTTRSLARIGEDILAYVGLVRTELVPNADASDGYDEYYWGEKCSVFKNDQGFYQPMVPNVQYFGFAQMIADGETLYMMAETENHSSPVFYINDRMVEAKSDLGSASARPRGVMSIGGTPYLFLSVSEGYSSTSWKGGVLVPLDPDMTAYGIDGVKLEANPTGLCATDGTLGYFLCGSELWYTDGETCGKIYDYANCGFSGKDAFRRILPLSDGRILTVAENMLIELTPVPKEEEVLRKTIVLGVVGTPDDDLVRRVGAFNHSQFEYTVTFRSFSDLTNLNLALLSGEITLIASKDILTLRNYADKGILADLEETVPELYEDGVLYKSVVDAARWKGKSYFIPRVFRLVALEILWRKGETRVELDTWEKLFGYIEKESPWTQKKTLKRYKFQTYGNMLDEWIDWEAGTCHFDDGSFARMLDFCNGCASSQDEANLYIEKIDQIVQLWIANPQETGSSDDLYGRGDTLEVFPWPSAAHKGNMIHAPYLIGVAANSGNEEGARAFLRHMFTENLREWDLYAIHPNWTMENGRELLFSINVTECERDITIPVEYYKANGLENYDKKAEKESMALVRSLLENADFYDYGSNGIYDVLYSEAQKVFAGELTSEKAAEYVQNRVSIYLAEQG